MVILTLELGLLRSAMSDERLPVVQYVRMSTDHQRYSTANQRAAIAAYADRNDMEIVATYEDSGKSGLHLDQRKALQQLLEVVRSGDANFKAILVYDVSRWGRFQNPDESAYYEYLCTLAGIKVIFCAEPFENDGSPLATIIKSIKRSMAAEYSRDLSTKVFGGHCRLARMGFRQGGPPGYGLKRVLLDENGRYKSDLAFGERKNLQSDRVVLAPGDPAEVEIVRRIYRHFIEDGMSERDIANALNREGSMMEDGRLWGNESIRTILISEKYTGRNVYGRTSSRLTKKSTDNAPALWVRCEAAFAPIVSSDTFEKAKAVFHQRIEQQTDEAMLEKLRALYIRHGYLNWPLIRAQKNMPSCYAYKIRFGSLLNAYALVGFDLGGLCDYIKIERNIKGLYAPLLSHLETLVTSRGGSAGIDLQRRRLLVNGAWAVEVEILRARAVGRHFQWRRRMRPSIDTDLVLLARMDFENNNFLDYFIIPSIYISSVPEWLKEKGVGLVGTYRFHSLEVLGDLVSPSTAVDCYEDRTKHPVGRS